MPRKNRRAETPSAPAPRSPQSEAPIWALAPGFDVRRVSSDKPYRCPGCDLEVRPGSWHFVVVPRTRPTSAATGTSAGSGSSSTARGGGRVGESAPRRA